jgi:hypothetical protein
MNKTPAVIQSDERAIVPSNAALVPIMDRLLMAAQGGMNIDMLERFMDLAERNEKREAEKAFHRAFAEFKNNPPQIVKDKLVNYGNTKYMHATIGSVVSAIIEGMSRHGLSHRWNIKQDGNVITVSCVITHDLGHSIETGISAGADVSGGKNSIQAIASTITYLQRYTLQAATGIAVLEADDDGRGAEGITGPPKKDQWQQNQKKQDEKKKEEKPKGNISDNIPPDRKLVEQWIDWIDQHVKIQGANVHLILERGWKEKLEPHLSTFPADHQNELTIAYKDTMKLLKEREVTK